MNIMTYFKIHYCVYFGLGAEELYNEEKKKYCVLDWAIILGKVGSLKND